MQVENLRVRRCLVFLSVINNKTRSEQNGRMLNKSNPLYESRAYKVPSREPERPSHPAFRDGPQQVTAPC